MCAIGSSANFDGTYDWLYWNDIIDGSVYYNQQNDKYLYPAIVASTYYYFISSYPNMTNPINTDRQCEIENVPAAYIFDVEDCLQKWSEPNMKILNCQDVCVSGNYWGSSVDGTYTWYGFYYDVGSPIYYNSQATLFLYGFIEDSYYYRWGISTDYTQNLVTSSHNVGVANGANYIFHLEDIASIINWLTWDGENYLSDSMTVQRCNYPTTSSPTTAIPTNVPTTSSPTTSNPTTNSPSTVSPSTNNPTTSIPTTYSPTTARPTYVPSTIPTTLTPTTMFPTASSTDIILITTSFNSTAVNTIEVIGKELEESTTVGAVVSTGYDTLESSWTDIDIGYVIIVVIGLIILVLFFIVILLIVICIRRKKKKLDKPEISQITDMTRIVSRSEMVDDNTNVMDVIQSIQMTTIGEDNFVDKGGEGDVVLSHSENEQSVEDGDHSDSASALYGHDANVSPVNNTKNDMYTKGIETTGATNYDGNESVTTSQQNKCVM